MNTSALAVLSLLCVHFPTCRVVLWSEKGELKKVVTMLMTISVTYFSRTASACFLSLVLLQACSTNQSRVRGSSQGQLGLEFLVSHCPGPSNSVTLGLCISSPRQHRARAVPGLVCWPRAQLWGREKTTVSWRKARAGWGGLRCNAFVWGNTWNPRQKAIWPNKHQGWKTICPDLPKNAECCSGRSSVMLARISRPGGRTEKALDKGAGCGASLSFGLGLDFFF